MNASAKAVPNVVALRPDLLFDQVPVALVSELLRCVMNPQQTESWQRAAVELANRIFDLAKGKPSFIPLAAQMMIMLMERGVAYRRVAGEDGRPQLIYFPHVNSSQPEIVPIESASAINDKDTLIDACAYMIENPGAEYVHAVQAVKSAALA